MPNDLKPEEIVAAFDEILDYVFGRSRGRDYPAKEDIKYATQWLEQGLTLPIACAVFYHRMSAMHDLWLKQINHADNKHIPATLKFFDEAITAGINRHKAGGEPIASWEQSESQWRARLRLFFNRLPNRCWNHDLWGPAPDEDGCRASPRLLAEAKKRPH